MFPLSNTPCHMKHNSSFHSHHHPHPTPILPYPPGSSYILSIHLLSILSPIPNKAATCICLFFFPLSQLCASYLNSRNQRSKQPAWSGSGDVEQDAWMAKIGACRMYCIFCSSTFTAQPSLTSYKQGLPLHSSGLCA